MLCRARRRIGAAPLRRLFETLAGPVGLPGQPGVFYRGLRTVAVDGTLLHAPDDPAITWRCPKRGGGRLEFGYPLLRLVALIECGALIRRTMRMLRTRSSGSLGRTQEIILHFHEVSAAIIAWRNKAGSDVTTPTDRVEVSISAMARLHANDMGEEMLAFDARNLQSSRLRRTARLQPRGGRRTAGHLPRARP